MRMQHILSVAAATCVLLAGCAPSPMAIPTDGAASSVGVQSPDAQTPAPAQTPTGEDAPGMEESPRSVSSSEPAPSAPTALLAPGAKGDDVREVQHRLLQLQWYEGAITDTYGDQTQAAVEGFQTKRGLPVTGEVDERTLQMLRDMTRQPTHDELFNVLKAGPALMKPGDNSDKVRDLQARMRQIGWYGVKIDGVYGKATVEGIRGFQEKRGFPVTGEVDQRTLDKLHAMTRQPTRDELNNVFPSVDASTAKAMQLDERCLTGRAICISKRQRKLAWVVDGQVQMQMAVRFGATRTPTREGAFRVEWKSRNHHSKLYDSAMPYALFFSGGQAVHYSSDFARRGYAGASHGCVNVRDKAKVAALFDLAREGDKVIVYA